MYQGRENITDKLPELEKLIGWFIEKEQVNSILDLTNSGFNPMQVAEFLKTKDYFITDSDSNGWEFDVYFGHANKKDIVFRGVGMLFELYLEYEEPFIDNYER